MLVFIFIFGTFISTYFLPLFMPCYFRKMHKYIFFLSFLICGCGVCRNLNFENKMQDMSNGTYLVDKDNRNAIWRFLNERGLGDTCHQFTHHRLGVWKIS